MENIILSGLTATDFFSRIEEIIDNKINSKAETKPSRQGPYFTRKQTASFLTISLPTLNTWTKEGILQSYRIGNRVLYKQEEVENSLHKTYTIKHKKYR